MSAWQKSAPQYIKHTHTHTSKTKMLINGVLHQVTSALPRPFVPTAWRMDTRKQTNDLSSHPAQCLWVWIIQFVSTKAQFVTAGMFSQALYPGCFALYTLIHRVRGRFQESNPHRGKPGWWYFTAVKHLHDNTLFTSSRAPLSNPEVWKSRLWTTACLDSFCWCCYVFFFCHFEANV